MVSGAPNAHRVSQCLLVLLARADAIDGDAPRVPVRMGPAGPWPTAPCAGAGDARAPAAVRRVDEDGRVMVPRSGAMPPRGHQRTRRSLSRPPPDDRNDKGPFTHASPVYGPPLQKLRRRPVGRFEAQAWRPFLFVELLPVGEPVPGSPTGC